MESRCNGEQMEWAMGRRRTIFVTMEDWVRALGRRRDLGRVVQGLAEGE